MNPDPVSPPHTDNPPGPTPIPVNDVSALPQPTLVAPVPPQPMPMVSVSASPVPTSPITPSPLGQPSPMVSPQVTVGGGFVPGAQPAAAFPPQVPQAPIPGQPIGPQMPVSSNKSKKPLIAALVVVVAAAVTAFGAVVIAGSMSGAEAKIGKEYIVAVQNKDYATIERLIDPEISKIGDKISKIGGSEAKEGFYKDFVKASEEQTAAGTGEAKKIKVIKETTGNDKYAVVTYKIGAKDATVIETYEADEPRVLLIESGLKSYPPDDFKSQYKDYKEQMAQMGTMIDQIAESSGPNSKSAVESLFSVN